MYKPSVDFYEHAFVAIWIVTQEFASLFWKSALTCISSTQPRAASKRDETLLKPAEDNRSGRVWKWSHFPPSTLDHRNNVRQSWRKSSAEILTPVPQKSQLRKFFPWQDPATGWHWAAPVPSCSEHDAARLENAEVWIKWSRDCTTENINVNIILGFAICS